MSGTTRRRPDLRVRRGTVPESLSTACATRRSGPDERLAARVRRGGCPQRIAGREELPAPHPPRRSVPDLLMDAARTPVPAGFGKDPGRAVRSDDSCSAGAFVSAIRTRQSPHIGEGRNRMGPGHRNPDTGSVNRGASEEHGCSVSTTGVLHCVEVICRSGRRWSDHGRRGRREVVEWRGDAWGSRHVTVLWSQDPCSVAAALSATRSFPEVWMRTRGRVRRIGTRNTCARIRGRSIRSELSEAGWCPTWSAWHCASIPLTHAHLPVVRRAGLLRVAALEVPVVAGA